MIVGNVGVNVPFTKKELFYLISDFSHSMKYLIGTDWYNEILIDKIIICLVGSFSIQLLYQILGWIIVMILGYIYF